MSLRELALGIALTATFATPAFAQDTHPYSLEATVGLGNGWGGRHPYTNTGAFAGEVIFAFRRPPEGSVGRIRALALGAQASPAAGDSCRLSNGPGGGCDPDFPAIAHLGFLTGLERRHSGSALRLIAGPAVFAGEGPSGLGAQLQADGALGLAHIALVAAVRGSVVVRFTGEVLRLGSLGIGVRLQ